MELGNTIDLARAAAAFVAIYFLIPTAAIRCGLRRSAEWIDDVSPAFIGAAFFVEVTVLILGDWRLCLPGSFAAIYAAWAVFTAAFASRRRWLFDNIDTRGGLLSMFQWLDRSRWEKSRPRRWPTLPPTVFAWSFSLAMFAAFFYNAWFPLRNLRFRALDTYSRALSLQVLVHGGLWEREGSVGLYAPVVFLSGLDPSAVIRMLSPVIFLLLISSAGYCAYAFSRRPGAAYLASALSALWMILAGPDSVGEMGSPELAAALLISAVAVFPRSAAYTGFAACTAAFMNCDYPSALIALLLIIFATLIATKIYESVRTRVPVAARAVGAMIPAALLVAICGASQSGMNPKAEYQYEPAARMVSEIAGTFRQNDWLIVSPGAEVSQLFGRGWHVEMADFVSSFSIEQVSRPDFRFPYAPRDIFVFLEKKPLDQAARHIAYDSHKTAFYYLTSLGRSSMEFQASRLITAYARTHTNAKIYYQDGDLLVYRVANGGPGGTGPP